MSVTYNLYLPEGYDASQSYPMVVFIADSSCAKGDAQQSLTQQPRPISSSACTIPSSHKRPDYLQRACDILLGAGKDPACVCGAVRNIGREGQEARVLTLAELRNTHVDMFTTVFIGNSQTLEIDGKMVTPRGYLQR